MQEIAIAQKLAGLEFIAAYVVVASCAVRVLAYLLSKLPVARTWRIIVRGKHD